MIKCPSCKHKFKNKYDICSNCGYVLTDIDKENIINSKNGIKITSIILTAVNGICFFFCMLLLLALLSLYHNNNNENLGKPIALIFVICLYIIVSIIQSIITISNLPIDIYMIKIKLCNTTTNKIKKQGVILLIINISLLLTNILAFILILINNK